MSQVPASSAPAPPTPPSSARQAPSRDPLSPLLSQALLLLASTPDETLGQHISPLLQELGILDPIETFGTTTSLGAHVRAALLLDASFSPDITAALRFIFRHRIGASPIDVCRCAVELSCLPLLRSA